MHADTLEQLLVEAGRGLFSLIVTNLDDVCGVCERKYQIERGQDDFLLFDWLGELLYTFETERLLLCQFQVQLQPSALEATCRGEPMNLDRHQMDHEVKAITYHRLAVEQIDGKWLAEVIVDI